MFRFVPSACPLANPFADIGTHRWMIADQPVASSLDLATNNRQNTHHKLCHSAKVTFLENAIGLFT